MCIPVSIPLPKDKATFRLVIPCHSMLGHTLQPLFSRSGYMRPRPGGGCSGRRPPGIGGHHRRGDAQAAGAGVEGHRAVSVGQARRCKGNNSLWGH